MTKRLHFKDNKLIGMDSGEPTISVDGPRTTTIEITVVGADEIIETNMEEKDIKKNFAKITLSKKGEILIDGKKIKKAPK